MLIGTHTSDNDQNYLQIAQVQLPSDSTPIDTRKFDDERGGKGSDIRGRYDLPKRAEIIDITEALTRTFLLILCNAF